MEIWDLWFFLTLIPKQIFVWVIQRNAFPPFTQDDCYSVFHQINAKNQIFVQNKYWLYSTVCVVVCLCVSACICECIIMYEIIILSSLQIQHHSSQDITRNYFDIMKKKPSKQWMHSTCSAILKDNYTSVAVWEVFCVRKFLRPVQLYSL